MILHSSIDGPIEGVAGGSARSPVVLLGSLGSTLDMWDPQVEALAATARCIRLDHRGHGGTPAVPGPYTLDHLGGDVLDTLDELDVDRAHLVGLSLGAMVAMWIAEHEPQRLDRLVVMCTSAALPPAAWIERAGLVRSDGMESVAATVVGRWFTGAYAEAQPDEVGRFIEMVRSCDPVGYAGCCEAIATMDLLDGLPGIASPTLAIAGRDDPATPAEHAERIVAAIPDAELVVVPGAHLASWECSAEVNTVLLDHLQIRGTR